MDTSSFSSPAPSPLLTADILAHRILTVTQRIDAAATSCGRGANDIILVAVTKTKGAEIVRLAWEAGLRDVGENYVQEALAKQEQIDAEQYPLRWHMMGHLQSNKTNSSAGRFHLLHGVDSLKLGRRIGAAASDLHITQNILVQVRCGSDPEKSGVDPSDVPRLIDELQDIEGLSVGGLMAVAPLRQDDGSESETAPDPAPYFAGVRALLERTSLPATSTLSMGMSNDFEAAIAEGSTMVRVGSLLFGPRVRSN